MRWETGESPRPHPEVFVLSVRYAILPMPRGNR
jgi:hypothetical protein